MIIRSRVRSRSVLRSAGAADCHSRSFARRSGHRSTMSGGGFAYVITLRKSLPKMEAASIRTPLTSCYQAMTDGAMLPPSLSPAHRRERFLHFAEAFLRGGPRLHVIPPCRQLRMPLHRRFGAEARQQHVTEENGGGERAVCQGEVRTRGEAVLAQHLLQLVEAFIDLGQFFVDD